MAAVTAVTAQNTLGVFGVWPLPLEAVQRQIEVVAADIGIDAVKIGMLGSADVVRGVASTLGKLSPFTVVLDPVMVAKGANGYLETDALDALRLELLPVATLVTPNLPEAETLTGLPTDSRAKRERAARRLVEMGAGAALIKGGHGAGAMHGGPPLQRQAALRLSGRAAGDAPHTRHRLHPLSRRSPPRSPRACRSPRRSPGLSATCKPPSVLRPGSARAKGRSATPPGRSHGPESAGPSRPPTGAGRPT